MGDKQSANTPETQKPQPANEPMAANAHMHLDDFLNTMHDEIKGKLGQVHVESLSAFAKAKKALGHIKQTEEQWRADLEAWLKEIPK